MVKVNPILFFLVGRLGILWLLLLISNWLWLWLNHHLILQPLFQNGFFGNLWDDGFGIFQNYLIEEATVRTNAALEVGFPVDEADVVEKVFFVFFIFFHLEPADVSFFNPFWQYLIVFHQLLFHTLLDVHNHVSSGFGFQEFFSYFHLFGIEFDSFVKSTKVKVKCALFCHHLDVLIIKFVPLTFCIYVVEVMTRLRSGSFMDHHSIQFIHIFFTWSCPLSKIQLFFVLKRW